MFHLARQVSGHICRSERVAQAARLFVPMLFNSDEEVEHSETSSF